MDLTKDIALIKQCLSSDAVTTCNDKCQWRHGKNDNTTVTPADPLFNTDFCHPVTISKDTTEAELKLCIDKSTSTDCSLEKGCNWSTGKELIPTGPFCAPAALTDDVSLIKTCISLDMETLCVGQCQWRQGLNPDGTVTVPPTVTPTNPGTSSCTD